LRTQWFRDALLGLSPILVGIQILLLAGFLPSALHGEADFGAFYVGGYMVHAGLGHQLYDYGVERQFQTALVSTTPAPYIHLPYEALLFAPLSLLHYRTAFLIFFCVNCMLAFFSFRAIRIDTHFQSAALLFFSYMPLGAALADGQDSILMLAITATSWWLLRRGSELSAGAVLALGLFRFQLLLPIAVLFLVWRRWRFVLGFLASSIVVLIGSVIMVGTSQMRLYFTHLVSMSVSHQEAVYSQPTARMVNIRGLVAGAFPASHSAAQLITLICSIALLIWTFRRARCLTSSEQFALAVCASVLVSYHLFVYDLSVLAIPMIIGVTLMNKKPSMRVGITVLIILLAAPTLLLANLLFLMALPLFAFMLAFSVALTDRLHVEPSGSATPAKTSHIPIPRNPY
jgi:hypothetical protein